MILRASIVVALMMVLSALRPAAADGALRAVADPRVDFLAAVARNAGFEEYRSPQAASPYAERVDALLKPHLAHPAFDRMRAMRKDRGLSYDAVVSLAVHVTDPPALAERVDFAASPAQLDRRLVPDEARALLVQLRDLAAACDWAAFWARERPVHDAGAAQLAAAVVKHGLVAWYERALGVKPGADYVLVAGLLTGENNFGVGVDFPDGRTPEIRPVIGCGAWDAQGMPVYTATDGLTGLVAHELCHSFANPVVDRNLEALRPAGERLFAISADRMRAQAYGDWKTTMYETLVRACTVRCLAEQVGDEAAAMRAQNDAARGFLWVPELAEALAGPLHDHPAGQTLDTLVPLIAATLEREAARIEQDDAKRPKLAETVPADGAREVAPGPIELVLRFDRPMRTDSYSVTGSKDNVPTGLKLKEVRDDGRTFVFTGTVEAGRAYVVGINGGGRSGFRTAEGVAALPVQVRFTTRAK